MDENKQEGKMKQFENKTVPSPRLMHYFSKLGDEWENLGVYDQAEDYYRKAMKISVRFYGSNHKFTQALSEKIGGFVTRQSA